MKKLFSFLQKTEFFLGSLGLLLAIILTFCQVVNRYWLHFEIMWISDAALYIFIFNIYVAISYGAAVKTHIAVDILPDVLCKDSRAKRALFDMAKSAVTVAMILAMWSPTLRVVKRAWKHPEFATLVRWFNTSWLVYAMGVMIVLSVLHYGWHVCEDIFELQKLRWEKEVKE